MTLSTIHRTKDSGFSFAEVVTALGVMIVLAAITVLVSGTAILSARADSAVQVLVRELREARELAISERRNIQVQFIAPNQITVTRRDVVGNVEVGTTVLKAVTLEGRLEYLQQAGAGDTPDGFGNAAAVDFGGATALIFTSEGTFVDQTGDPLNGTVFLSEPNEPTSLRAVTVFGPNALVRTFAWNGATWTD